ncbi:MAG: hypothetical protein AABM29_10495 [Actinomycetota bacterium]
MSGGEQRTVLGASQRGPHVLSGASWTSDGELFVFWGGRRKTDEGYRRSAIYLAQADGTVIRKLTRVRNAFTPVISPDGHTIAFGRFRYTSKFYGGTIWLIQSDGTGLRRITRWTNRVLDEPSSFTSDGKQLAFTHSRCNRLLRCRSTARKVALDGSGETLLARNAGDPVLSPTGDQVAFSSTRDRNGEIRTGEDESEFAAELYVMKLDTSVATRLTRTKNLNENSPSWDPSGERIAFARGADRFRSRVMQINADGTCMQALLKSSRKGHVDFDAPTWRPGPGREAGRITC